MSGEVAGSNPGSDGAASPAPTHVLLVDVARRAQLPPERLLELALADPRLQLAVRQSRWLYDGVFEATGYGDEPTLREAELALPDEDPPHRLRSGLALLRPDRIDRLRFGPIEVNRVTELERGLDVHLLSTKQITIDLIWIEPESWAPALEALVGPRAETALSEIATALRRLEAQLGSEPPEIMTRSQALATLGGRRVRGSWATALVDRIQIPTGGKTMKVLREDLFEGLRELRDGEPNSLGTPPQQKLGGKRKRSGPAAGSFAVDGLWDGASGGPKD